MAFKVVIDLAKCVDCAICVDACESTVYVVDEKSHVHPENDAKCNGCRTCIEACPVSAISVRKVVN